MTVDSISLEIGRLPKTLLQAPVSIFENIKTTGDDCYFNKSTPDDQG
jgi:hypothetical protein